MQISKWSTFFLFTICLLAASCSTSQKSQIEDPEQPVTVAGKWEGIWWYAGKESEGQRLSCVCVPIGQNQWTATFDAEYGQRTLYTFDIQGEKQGNTVVFSGAVDLGEENGGVYHWQGIAQGDTFTGKYKSQYNQGGFQMEKVDRSI